MSNASNSATQVDVYLEIGAKRSFAAAIDWPGWCRSGKDAPQALAALEASAPRYAVVAREAVFPFPDPAGVSLDVVEQLTGTATTDFGAPDRAASRDLAPFAPGEAERLAALVAAAWVVFDRVVARAPAELRKGPRGGGRDRDAIVAHVVGAEVMYARKLGLRHAEPAADDHAAIVALRTAIVETLRVSPTEGPPVERGWPPRYAARRIAWHVLDHAWEIEDKSS